jgi:hypothetical protein
MALTALMGRIGGDLRGRQRQISTCKGIQRLVILAKERHNGRRRWRRHNRNGFDESKRGWSGSVDVDVRLWHAMLLVKTLKHQK